MGKAPGLRSAIALAAGGTGGHLFPAAALAEEIARAGMTPVLITDNRFHGFEAAFANVEVRMIAAARMGGGVLAKSRGSAALGLGILQAKRHLATLRPLAVVGFGGYPSFPTVIAAFALRVPVILHEQNAILGRANRLLARGAKAIALTYPETARVPHAARKKIRLTGNPVRASVRALSGVAYTGLRAGDALSLLILGGSQGASIFGAILPAACALLSDASRARIRVVQQARAADLEPLRAAYRALGMEAELAPFFGDMPVRLANAHLVISRAGASTLAELMIAARPAILVPLPSAMDDHQTANACAFTGAGGGWLMPQASFTPEGLAAKLEGFLANPGSLPDAAAKAKAAARPDAAHALNALVMEKSLSNSA